MNKRGLIFEDMLVWLLRIIFLTVVVFCVVFLIRMLIVENVQVSEIEMDYFAKRVYLSKQGFAFYDDKIDRVYPGIIDYQKFAYGQERLENAMYYGEKNQYIAAKVYLKNNKTEFIYNERRYSRWKPLSNLNLIGIGGARSRTFEFPVIVKDNDNTFNDVLVIDVATPNS
jgi:hypothetical protein